MAVLTSQQYHDLRRAVYTKGSGKEELQALPALPNESQFLAAFQAIEDFWENNRAALKTAIEAALGQAITNACARKILIAWLQHKLRIGG